ncbi:MAG TPA: amino acid adenylation domain-containing protein [Gemmatimonadales bacterium]|nr:amino acid adenylation domain-containing protein [Gemmatimonadales bacterium]
MVAVSDSTKGAAGQQDTGVRVWEPHVTRAPVGSAVEFLLRSGQLVSERPCVSDGRVRWSYREVIQRAGAVAGALAQQGIRGKPVLLFFPRGVEGVVAIAGTLMSGNYYVPLDVAAPAARQQLVLSRFPDARVLTCSEHARLLPPDLAPTRTVLLDSLWNHGLPSFQHALVAAAAATERVLDCDPVYVMHTSGSTGVPKGVTIAHRGVIDYIRWAADLFALTPADVLGNQAPLHFDNSTLDVFLSWACGAELYVIPASTIGFPGALVRDLRARRVSFVFFVPSALIAVARCRALEGQTLPDLKVVAFAGEVMPTKHLLYWQDHHPVCKYVNLYGPTEITVDCTYYVVDRRLSPDEPVPIGRPRCNMDVVALDERGEPVERGKIGELCVRGSALALGYWSDAEATSARFVQNPAGGHYADLLYRTGDLGYVNDEGQLVFVGRRDTQIKHLGHRIELEEIEVAAVSLDGVANACALYDRGASEIVLVYESPQGIAAGDVAAGLAHRLPRYMVPRRIVAWKRLPLTGSGKVDRQLIARELC